MSALADRLFRSARARKDPSMTQHLSEKFEAELVKLYERAAPGLVALLGSGPVDIEAVSPKLDVLLESEIAGPAGKVIYAASRANCRAGVVRSSQFLTIARQKPREMAQPMYVSPDVVRIVEARAAALVKGLTDDMRKRIVTELVDGISKGEGSNELARRIRDEVDVSMERASVIARTETMTAFNDAAKDNYAVNGVTEVEWLSSTEDGRLCEECADLNGKKYLIDSAPDCPAHPNCRCTLLPVIAEV